MNEIRISARMHRFTRTTPWLRATLLLAVVTLLPVAAVYSQDELKKDGDAKAETPVDKKVDKEKTITREDLAVIAEQVKEALAAGQITPEEGRARLDAARKGMARQRTDRAGTDRDGTYKRIRGHLLKNGLTDVQIKPAFGVIKKLVTAIQKAGDRFQLDATTESYLRDDLVLSREQIALVVGIAHRMAARSGRGNGDLAGFLSRMQPHLEKNGFTAEQIEGAFGAMKKLVPAMQKAGENFELDPRFSSYFAEELGLSNAQVGIVVGASRRIARALNARKQDGQARKQDGAEQQRAQPEDAKIEEHYKKLGVSAEAVDLIRVALAKDGFSAQQIDDSLGGLLRVVHEMKSEGDSFELNPRLRDYFTGRVGLTDAHITTLEGIASGIVEGAKKPDRGN